MALVQYKLLTITDQTPTGDAGVVLKSNFIAIDDALDNLTVAMAIKTNIGHLHAIANVTSLQTTLDSKATTSALSTHTGSATIHRSINDGVASTTVVWSGSKINTSLGTKLDKATLDTSLFYDYQFVYYSASQGKFLGTTLSGGNSIDDLVTNTNTTWSSNKINNELNNKQSAGDYASGSHSHNDYAYYEHSHGYASIDDYSTSTGSVWSSEKTQNAISAAGGPEYTQVTYTGATALPSTDATILCNAVAAFTLVVATASSVLQRRYIFKKMDATYNKVTIEQTGADTIDGSTIPYLLEMQYEFVSLEATATGWVIIGE